MVLVAAWKRVVAERYAQFSGRAARPEFWWFVVTNFIIAAILFALGTTSGVFYVLYVIYVLALIVPDIAVTARRLHDTGRSALWILLILIPLIGGIVVLVFCAQSSQPDTNTYGPPADPLPS